MHPKNIFKHKLLYLAMVTGLLAGVAIGSNSLQLTVHAQEPSLDATDRDLRFVTLRHSGGVTNQFFRAKVPGGWLIAARAQQNQHIVSMVFVPDEEHTWDGDN